jgi:hypothetical protein
MKRNVMLTPIVLVTPDVYVLGGGFGVDTLRILKSRRWRDGKSTAKPERFGNVGVGTTTNDGTWRRVA